MTLLAPDPDPSRRFADEIAPMPIGEVPPQGAALAMFRAHAARAQALWASTTGGDHTSDGTWAVEPMLAEWRAARAWAVLALGPEDPEGGPVNADRVAADVALASAAPQCIGPEIYAMCTAAGVNPDCVRPYQRRDVLAQDTTDTDVAPGQTVHQVDLFAGLHLGVGPEQTVIQIAGSVPGQIRRGAPGGEEFYAVQAERLWDALQNSLPSATLHAFVKRVTVPEPSFEEALLTMEADQPGTGEIR